MQCSADRRGHTEGGRAAPEKFHLSDPKEQEGSSRSIKPAVIRSSLRPQPTPQTLPHKLRPRRRALTAPAPRQSAAPVPRPPEPLDSSLGAPGRRRARPCSAPRLPLAARPLPAAVPGAPARHRSAPSPSAPRAPPPARLMSDGSDTCSPSLEPPARAAAPPGAPARAPLPPPPRAAAPRPPLPRRARGKGGKGKEAEGGNFLAPDGKSAAHSANTTG